MDALTIYLIVCCVLFAACIGVLAVYGDSTTGSTVTITIPECAK